MTEKEYVYACAHCGKDVTYSRAVRKGNKPGHPKCKKSVRNKRALAKLRETVPPKKPGPKPKRPPLQAGEGIGQTWKPSPKAASRAARLDALCELYQRLETTRDPGVLLQLQAEFAELRAPCHVNLCQQLYQECVA